MVTNLGFDVLSRLTSLENDVTGSSNDQTLTFTHITSSQLATRTNSNTAYDWDGATILSESYSINDLNQILAAAISNIPYDPRGNTVAAGSKTQLIKTSCHRPLKMVAMFYYTENLIPLEILRSVKPPQK